jgi:hypothetical protein
MAELKLSGNHLKGSRPVLSFHAVRTHAPCARQLGAYSNLSLSAAAISGTRG